MARPLALLAILLLAGCGGGQYASGWNGRRGYDGNGDYGYDPAASRSEARGYRAGAASHYPVPGTAADPWGPYVREAAATYQVPERWIRAVMRQESGGRQYSTDGGLITSSAGAMGLMQVMPGTYDILRQHYRLGPDPFEPHDNIMAGTAYIREMYVRYGAPAFLAAYNAGPMRLETYLAGSGGLPDETVNYLARIAPNLGTEIAMTGPLAVYAGGATRGTGAPVQVADVDRAYAGGGLMVGEVANDDPANRAYEGGGLVTAAAPTGVTAYAPPPVAIQPVAIPPGPFQPAVMADAQPPPPTAPIYQAASYARPTAPPARMAASGGSALAFARTPPLAPPPQPVATRIVPVAMLVPSVAPGSPASGWAVQVGAFSDPSLSRAAAATAQSQAPGLLGGATLLIQPVQRDTTLFRARLAGLSADRAVAACAALTQRGVNCLTVPPSQ